MQRWPQSRQALALAVGLVLVAALAPSLGGCGNGASPFKVAYDVLRGGDGGLDDEGSRHISRFAAVYQQYAASGETRPGGKLQHFNDIFKRVRSSYVHEVSDPALIEAAIKGVRDLEAVPGTVDPPKLVEAAVNSMLASLDPHSRYLNPEEFREMQVQTRGEFGGLGIEVTMEEDGVRVVSPIEDTPAFRAGLEPEDLITHLDGASLQGRTLMHAVNLMRGRPGTDIRLTIRRKGVAPFDVTVTRAVILVRAVRWSVEDDIAYVRVAHFTEQMEEGVVHAMAEMRQRLGPRLKGVVLDLRRNPGGLLTQSVSLADAFLERGRIVSVRGRRSDRERAFEAEPGDLAAGAPMVVLIDRGSASASEIVAGALQDHRRAVVMGARSFGKGSVQTITPLPIEGALKLTTQLYYAPSGRAIQGIGVNPDIIIDGVDGNPDDSRREIDLPGALPALVDDDGLSHTQLSQAQCPEAGAKKDRELGCAITWLHAGSTERFLAAIRARPRI